MKRMLFNATQQEELRVAIVDGQKLIDIDIEIAGREQHKSNIYKAVVTRIEPSLEACFVNYGEDRHGFLPFKEVTRAFFKEGVDVRNASVKTALREGQEIMVQVEKEERGNKGAALTTFVSLAGRYLVLMPNNPRGGGVSRRVEGEERQELREAMDKLELPAGMSVIARTAGIGRSVEELQWDLNYLLQLWRAIDSAGKSGPGAFLIYHESSLVIRAIRDYFQPDIGEILVDTDEIYEQARQFMSHVMPDMVHRVKRYTDDVPLFSRFQIEHQIETAYSRTVPLPSGGAIVIDHTEALVSIDVNSARSTRGTDIETTAFNTNCEAAEEVARQLRLRDLGGLIVIDFIDMESSRNQREIENRLKDALHYDRARVQMGKISRFGLMELSRQRLRPSLSEGTHVTCPRCNGTGHIRDIESSALQVLRIIQEEAMKENSAMIHAQMPVDVAAFLLNEKRGEIMKIETRHHVRLIVIPNKHLETPHYKLERIKQDDPRIDDSEASYALAEQADTDAGYNKRQKEATKPRQEAVVQGFTPVQPAPVRKQAEPAAEPAVQEEGFFTRLFGLFRSKPAEPAAAPAPAKEDKPAQGGERSARGRGRGRRGGRDRDERETRRNEPREEQPAKQQPKTEAEPAAPRPPRQPRQPREGARNERQRDERKEAVATESRAEDVQNDKALLAAGAGVATVAVTAAGNIEPAVPLQAVDEAAPQLADGVEAPEQTGEEPRRRRRRGGRNRRRGDRPARGDAFEGSENMAEGGDEQAADESPAFAEQVIPPFAEPINELPAVAAELAEPAVSAATGAATQVVAAAEQKQVAVALSAVPPEVASAEQENEAPFCWTAPELAPVSVETPAAPVEAPVEVEAQAQLTLVIADEAPVETAAPQEAVALEVETAPAAVVEAPAAVPAQPAAVVAASEVENAPEAASGNDDISDILAAAGLTMATTDPDKVRAVQSAQPEPAEAKPVRRRMRRPLSQAAEEPLVQVDTRRD
ncbi:MAG: Rne/Rng family ribonuclease [Burkholderiaceae bacterium]|nr:Rne/Rng family ribonuclease [Burkholderiaceae bacterium]